MGRRKARRETSAGGVIVRRGAPDGPHYLLILDAHHNWGFPKGHLKRGESPEHAARREVLEETGLDNLVLRAPIAVIDWFFRFRGRLIHKFCHFFLFESASGEPTPQREEGITACTWYPLADALTTIGYENARDVLRRGAELLDRLPETQPPEPC